MRARALLKRLADALAALSVAPTVLRYRAEVALLPSRRDDAFQSLCQRASKWAGGVGVYRRRAVLRATLRRTEGNFFVGFGTLLATPEIEIGAGVYIGPFGNIAHSVIGRDCLLGSNVTILAGTRQHGIERLDVPIAMQPRLNVEVRIGEDVWIGNHAIVAADVGAHAVVGAGAVVVKRVPEYAIVVGNPGRVVGDRRQLARGEPTAAPASPTPLAPADAR
ncbi:DapH/DapD/GlmU-related protein [Roseisolibacter sp. H3M3-2]|uniref:acyltransferase n=1 Tax=Roseisolibacter sp. H3M3-2 TaxID=3031323 RepID=UPI0023DC29FE|nr:DapH/DapD/GlmU-related protein [Roseisolibacter sp. H3M3-2]MDF1505353.1 DapH/DapD/GlmU-related protein [Roseisolibacter sp. H3M3-2]